MITFRDGLPIALLSGVLVLSLMSCAHRMPSASTAQQQGDVRIYELPLDLALAEAAELLSEQHIRVHPTKSPGVLASDVKDWSTDGSFGVDRISDPLLGTLGEKNIHNRLRERTQWVIVGRALAPRRSAIAIFQIAENALEVAGGGAEGTGASTNFHSPEGDFTDLSSLAQFQSPLAAPVRAEPVRSPTLEHALSDKIDAVPSVETSMESVPPRSGFLALGLAPDAGADGCSAEPQVDTSDIETFFAPGNVLLLGDRLGTAEAPKVFAALACNALRRHLPVLVALNLPESEQLPVNRFLLSNGGDAARTRLLFGSFWRNPYPDGASSRAIVDLLDRIRQWRQGGDDVTVVAYDNGLRGNEREAAASARIAEERSRFPGAFTLVLGGNVHLTRRAGAQWDADYLPLGHRIARDGTAVLALDVAFDEGKHWACRLFAAGKLDCGVSALEPSPPDLRRPADSPPAVHRFAQTSEYGWDGIWYVSRLSPSPPAQGN